MTVIVKTVLLVEHLYLMLSIFSFYTLMLKDFQLHLILEFGSLFPFRLFGNMNHIHYNTFFFHFEGQKCFKEPMKSELKDNAFFMGPFKMNSWIFPPPECTDSLQSYNNKTPYCPLMACVILIEQLGIQCPLQGPLSCTC